MKQYAKDPDQYKRFVRQMKRSKNRPKSGQVTLDGTLVNFKWTGVGKWLILVKRNPEALALSIANYKSIQRTYKKGKARRCRFCERYLLAKRKGPFCSDECQKLHKDYKKHLVKHVDARRTLPDMFRSHHQVAKPMTISYTGDK